MGVDPLLIAGLGAALSLFLSAIGSAYGSFHAGIFAMRTFDSSGWFFAFAPVAIAGVLSIYGIIIAIIIAGKMEGLSEKDGYKSLSSGLCVGTTCLVSGIAMGRFLDKHIEIETIPRPFPSGAQQEDPAHPLLASARREIVLAPRSGWKILVVLSFLEAIGLYGLIVALILSGL